uniref:Integrase, catalytic region, zinc finger, CCHC-type, peptidase aspartic, catalytic n=1 Tax=Tanacetum cinerariifolium TaxID=118510 RepID=A0A6L2N2W7_TANCI|nr:integrase, catalytic region, zinc finger, CCHC-type, peptidase aspartic, catalytic [Tanacetum cinerariifolium]
MSRDVLTVGSTMRIPLLYREEYSQWFERFMNYLEEQTDGEAMINLIKNGDQPLLCVTQVSIVGTTSTEQPHLKYKSMWSDQEKRVQKIDRLARSLLIQGLSNDIYSLIDSNKTAKDLWDALARHILGSEYGEQDRKAAVLYEYETFKATKGELLLDTYIRYLQVINDLKKCGYSKDNYELNFKFLNNLQPEWKQQTKNLMDINIDALYNIQKQNQGDVNDALGYKKKAIVVTSDPLALVAEKMKEGHFTKDCKKSKVKDYNCYKTKMLLDKKDSDEQVLLAEDQAWMESSSDSDQEINANMVFMAQIEKFLSDSEASSSSTDEKISEQTSLLKPYVSNMILEKIIIDLEDEVVNLLEKEKVNLETIESLKSKGVDSSETVSFESENQSENDCYVVEKQCGNKESSNVIAPGMFKLNVSQCVSPISMSKSSCDSNNVEIKLKRKRRDRSSNLYTIALNEVASNSSTCLLEKASSLQSWVWHQRLSHLNFPTINNLMKNNHVQGLPKMKFEKDHLCSACE